MLRVPGRLVPGPSPATGSGQNLYQAQVPARVSAGRLSPGRAITSCRHRGRRVSAPKLLLLHFVCTLTSAARCLTPRSSGAPTAGHQARSGGTRYIFASPGLASCRRRPLTSNVRQRKVKVVACRQTARPSGLVFTHPSSHVLGSWLTRPTPFSSNWVGPKPLPSASACPRERGPTVPATCHHLMPPPWLARERAKVAPAALCCAPTTVARCLTPRSSGAPTAGHQAQAGGRQYIFASPGLASCRRRPLSSNVRRRNPPLFACHEQY